MSRQRYGEARKLPGHGGVNPAGIAGKRRGLPWEVSGPVRTDRTTTPAMALEGHGGVSRGHSTGLGRAGKGRTSKCRETDRMTRRAWSGRKA